MNTSAPWSGLLLIPCRKLNRRACRGRRDFLDFSSPAPFVIFFLRVLGGEKASLSCTHRTRCPWCSRLLYLRYSANPSSAPSARVQAPNFHLTGRPLAECAGRETRAPGPSAILPQSFNRGPCSALDHAPHGTLVGVEADQPRVCGSFLEAASFPEAPPAAG